MSEKRLEVGLFECTASGVRLVGRTQDQSTVRGVQERLEQLGAERARRPVVTAAMRVAGGKVLERLAQPYLEAPQVLDHAAAQVWEAMEQARTREDGGEEPAAVCTREGLRRRAVGLPLEREGE